jgi:hypothetical protein
MLQKLVLAGRMWPAGFILPPPALHSTLCPSKIGINLHTSAKVASRVLVKLTQGGCAHTHVYEYLNVRKNVSRCVSVSVCVSVCVCL